ncbi:uncharacterized protein LOC133825205 [Humulus lupulus]|uniref:uncharacterized protein LOC133825205 n=1 Tax=Humulus lupulus TaxID=3486 RepID=UPI002B4105EC|nr:uncharacterized protein LOC133825205 [Humulus lupulus]
MEFEKLYEAWDRFKEMLRKCHQHDIEDCFQVQLFYNGLNGPTRSHIDATSGRTILSKTLEEALILFEDMAMNSCQWQSERSTVKKVVGAFEVYQITSLMVQMSSLTNQIKGLTQNKVAASKKIVNVAQAFVRMGWWMNNANINVLQPPQEPPRQIGEKPSPSLEQLLKTYIVDSKARLDQHDTRLNNIETHCTDMGAMMKTLETQVGQLTNTMKTQMSRSFPSDTEKNPKECNAITLRSGKELDAPTVEKKKVDEILMNAEKEEDKQNEGILKKEPRVANLGSFTFPDNPPKITTPLPFPQRFHKKEIDEQFAIFNLMPLSIFQKLNLGEVTPTTISLQLANRSLTSPRGIIEDVLEEDQEIMIILGRTFLAIGKALIDVHDGNLTLRVNGEEVKFNISNTMKFPKEKANCKRVDVVNPCLRDLFKTMFHKDPLELCLTTPISKEDLGVDLGMNDMEVVDSVFALEALQVKKEVSKKEDIYKALTLDNSLEKKNTTSDGLVLKQLFAHLRYAFLGDRSTNPIIISASLNEEDERKLLETLKRYSSAFLVNFRYH